MNKENFEESEKILEEEEKHVLFTEKEVENAREELNLLGIENPKLYDFNTEAKDDILLDDEDYYRKSA